MDCLCNLWSRSNGKGLKWSKNSLGLCISPLCIVTSLPPTLETLLTISCIKTREDSGIIICWALDAMQFKCAIHCNTITPSYINITTLNAPKDLSNIPSITSKKGRGSQSNYVCLAPIHNLLSVSKSLTIMSQLMASKSVFAFVTLQSTLYAFYDFMTLVSDLLTCAPKSPKTQLYQQIGYQLRKLLNPAIEETMNAHRSEHTYNNSSSSLSFDPIPHTHIRVRQWPIMRLLNSTNLIYLLNL